MKCQLMPGSWIGLHVWGHDLCMLTEVQTEGVAYLAAFNLDNIY